MIGIGGIISGVNRKKVAIWTGVVVVFVIICFMIYYVYKNYKSRQAVRDEKKAIIHSDLSFDDSDYSRMADELYEAMNGFGTKSPTIFSVLNVLRTASDWHQLFVSFDVRSSTGNWAWWNPFKDKNLTNWLEYELSADELGNVRVILHNIQIPF